jgi:hypothetical protein
LWLSLDKLGMTMECCRRRGYAAKRGLVDVDLYA